MSLTVCLDTALLAVPNYADSEAGAEEVISRIEHWANFVISFGSRRVVRSERLEASLGELGFFPAIDNIRQLIDVVGLRGVYDANTVWKSYNTILNRAGILSDVLGFESLRVENAHSQPDILLNCFPAGLRAETENMMATSVLADALNIGPATLVGSGLAQDALEVGFGGVVVETLGASPPGLDLPKPIEGSALLVNRVEDLMGRWPSEAIWERASDAADIYFAIMVRAMEIEAAAGRAASYRSVPRFHVGPEFFSSLRNNDCHGAGNFAGTALDSCARVVLRQPKEELKPFEQLRPTDKAVALRTHITKRGVGLRLMLWQRLDGTYEFANVGPKFELEIEEGDEGQGFAPE